MPTSRKVYVRVSGAKIRLSGKAFCKVGPHTVESVEQIFILICAERTHVHHDDLRFFRPSDNDEKAA